MTALSFPLFATFGAGMPTISGSPNDIDVTRQGPPR